MSDLNTQLLINMGSQLAELQEGMGSVKAQLVAGAKQMDEQKQTLEMLDRRTDITESKVVKIDDALNPEDEPSLLKRVANLEAFNGKIGVIISFGSIVLWGVAYFIWNTLTWLWANLNVKGVFKGLFD